tara:strand:- start:132 stop:1064 length:933 start_codon:yes stop_codon:yes gene_type:complete
MGVQQYIRECKLKVADDVGAGLDLSQLHIVFSIKKADSETPNVADITVYNLSDSTATRIKKEFSRVVLQAGYQENYGTIFAGNIQQVRIGRDNGTDTYINIVAGDGDQAYISAVVNKTLAAGSTAQDRIDAAVEPMTPFGVQKGFIADTGAAQLPRGKTMFGMSRDQLRTTSKSTGTTWSIQDGKVQFVQRTGVLPTTAVVITSRTGMVGVPQQTDKGVTVRCLLNPMIKVGGLVRLENAAIQEAQIDISSSSQTGSDPASVDNSLSTDGIYRVLVVDYVGDNRGGDWYSDLTCLSADVSAPAGEEVSAE